MCNKVFALPYHSTIEFSQNLTNINRIPLYFFEDMVFEQMIETIKELREENKRLVELNKPSLVKVGESDETD